MEKYTATAAAEETTDAKPELVAHVAKTLEGVSTIPSKKGWSLRQLGRFRVKREAS